MKRLAYFFPLLIFACSKPAPEQSVELPADSRQLVLVITPNNMANEGTLQRYERKEANNWQPVGDAHPVTVGRSGLAWGRGEHPSQTDTQKQEGDGKAPSGIFRLTSIFGYEPPLDLGLKMPFVRASETLECVDDSKSKFYNQLVDSLNVEKDWTSSEFMRRDDHQYRWGVTVAHNSPDPVPQGGSCIFLHIWKEPGTPTSGCTAMAEDDLLRLIHWLDEEKSPVLVQLTQSEFDKWKPLDE